MSKKIPGKFVWFELTTPDPAKQDAVVSHGR